MGFRLIAIKNDRCNSQIKAMGPLTSLVRPTIFSPKCISYMTRSTVVAMIWGKGVGCCERESAKFLAPPPTPKVPPPVHPPCRITVKQTNSDALTVGKIP
ncbi:hypothetical protein niasHT_021421 [Heterodera trifolii]|uniref:Uncharacterized protein n=1 Tax=Heterodera trifolii TaxID=157864 RepID=A0ABD2K6S7_9BILA